MGFFSRRLILLVAIVDCLLTCEANSHSSKFFPSDIGEQECVLPNSNEQGVCIFGYLCKDGIINTDGSELIDLRSLDVCDDYLLKCCSKQTLCQEGMGRCVPDDNCGADLNEPKYRFFKNSNDCNWSGYNCCPKKHVGEKRPSIQHTQTREACGNNGEVCVPDNQCSISADGRNIIENRASQCRSLDTCCPLDKIIRKSSLDPCTEIGGRCVPEDQCSAQPVIDEQASQCISQHLVCCTGDIIDSTSPADSEEIVEPPSSWNNGEPTTQRTTTTDHIEGKPIPFNNDYISRGCGYRNEAGIGFSIIGDADGESQYGEFPWMVAIFAETSLRKAFACGGSLINPEVILTTADCVKSFRSRPEKLIIRAGEWDMGSTKETIPYEERKVRLVKIHPAFKSTSLVNNVALLFLDDKYDSSQTIDTVCLPPQNFTIDNGHVTATGWGTTPKDRTKYQQILKSLELEFKQRSECESSLRRVTNPKFKLDKSFICAGGEKNVDTCRGDAGSPIVFHIPDDLESRVYAVGMVSWGVGCGRPGIPSAYTHISRFRDWIDDQMGSEGLTVHYYQYEKQTADEGEQF